MQFLASTIRLSPRPWLFRPHPKYFSLVFVYHYITHCLLNAHELTYTYLEPLFLNDIFETDPLFFCNSSKLRQKVCQPNSCVRHALRCPRLYSRFGLNYRPLNSYISLRSGIRLRKRRESYMYWSYLSQTDNMHFYGFSIGFIRCV